MHNSRTSKSIKNSIISLVFYFTNLIVQFFSRKIFLEYLGSEILGLNSTATNLLQFLNLAELGISTAVGFSLYKPLFEKDEETISEIVSLQGHIYKRIAFFIILGAVILMFFFPLIFKKINLPLWYAYASFGVLLYSALLGYFFNYKQVVLSANQEEYKIHYSFKTVNMLKAICQMVAVRYLTDGYVWWLGLEVLFGSIASYCLHRITIASFPHLCSSKFSFSFLRKKYSDISKKIGQLFFHKIGGFALTQSSPLIIYAFADLKLVAYYGNYLIVIQGIDMLSRAVFNSINAGIGNLVAEGDMIKIRRLFDELFSLRFVLVTTLCYSLFQLTPTFINLWIGPEYLLGETTLFLMILMLYIQLFRLAAEAFSYAFGIYGDIGAPIIEAILNIGLSIIGGYYFNLNGILLGSIISQIIIVVIWKPYYLFHTAMIGYGNHYISIYVKHVSIFSVVLLLQYAIFNHLNINFPISWFGLFKEAFLKVPIFALLMIGAMMLFKMPIINTLKRLKLISQ